MGHTHQIAEHTLKLGFGPGFGQCVFVGGRLFGHSLRMTDEIQIPKAAINKHGAYWRALGRFVDQFAKVESQLHTLLWQESEVNFSLAPAIFSGFRVDQAKDIINRIRQSKGRPESATLARAFSQLTIINKARNDILHYGANFDGTDFIVSTKLAAHIPERERKFSASPKTLQDMTIDLYTIQSALAAYSLEAIYQLPDVAEEQLASLTPVLEAFQKSADAPWQYKLDTPPPPSRRPLGNPPKPKRQRGA
jgi:hypothetical protein